MAENDKASMADGFQSLLGGMQAGLDPEVVGDDAYSLGVNVISRGGLARTRPGFVKGPTLPSGIFQGMSTWVLHGARRLVIVLSGRVVLVDADTDAITDLGVLLDVSALCNFIQADRYLIVLNGVDRPLILQETAGVPEIVAAPASFPTSPIGAYVFGRIHLSPNEVPGTDPVENGRPYVVSGDIMQPDNPASCLEFTETDYWGEGGAHGLPLEMGYITAFSSLRNVSTGTGYGPLLVFAESGVSAFDVSVPRDEWKDTGLAQVLFFGPGAVSPWATLQVNGTVLYRAADGLRLLSYAASAAQGKGGSESLGNIPQSKEVEPYMTDSSAYFSRISAAAAGNRIFVTAGGEDGVWFKGMVVLDVARASSLESPVGATAYDGAWQIMGRRIGGIAATRRGFLDTLFAYCDDGALWRLDESATNDNGTEIQCRLITRALTQGSGYDRKRLVVADAWVRGLTKSGALTLRYRPTLFPYWASAGSQAYLIGAGSLAQKRHFTFSFPFSASAACDPGEHMFLSSGSSFQFALDWTGPAVIGLFRTTVKSDPEGPAAPCGDKNETTIAVPANAEVLGVWL